MPYKPVDRNITIKLGVAVDDTDFKTVEDAITWNATDLLLMVIIEHADGQIETKSIRPTNPATSPQPDYAWVNLGNGYYSIAIPASGGDAYNNENEGIITITGIADGVLPFQSVAYDVIPTDEYDSHVRGTQKQKVDINEINGDSASPEYLRGLVTDGYDSVANKIEGVKTADTTTTNTDMRGTDSALLAANITLSGGVVEANLVQMGGVAQSATDLKDFADAGYDPASNKVNGVVLVDTTTTNSDMRGTDSAALASNYTAARAGYLDNINNHTAQTGDSYAIVNSGTFGNAQLVRSTTPANALDVSATGEAGLDFNNLKVASGATTLTNITVPVVTTTGTCTTNTDMRGTDSANTTVPDAAGVAPTAIEIRQEMDSNSTRLSAIETDTTGLNGAAMRGTDGANTTTPLTAAETQSECNDALVALRLDHLVAVADSDDVVNDSIIAKLASSAATADWSTFVNTTDALQAIRDNQSAAANVNVTQVRGVTLDSKAGSNFNVFFNNGGADSTKTQNDVGAGSGGSGTSDFDPDTDTVDTGMTWTATMRQLLAILSGNATLSSGNTLSYMRRNGTTTDVALRVTGNSITRTTG